MNYEDLRVGQRLRSLRDAQRPWIVRVLDFNEYSMEVYSEDWKENYTIQIINLMWYEVIDEDVLPNNN